MNHSNKSVRLYIYKSIFLCIGFAILLQNPGLAQRPKVGLVLSGGGAKGIAHIGILQAADSAGLKIDYITGTSMGSIIGALYAIGYSGKDIEKISHTLNWDVILSNKPNYPNISIDEKDEYGRYSIEVGMEKFKPQIATGLIESEELWLTLNRLFLPVYNIKDFSKFNIPFRCIATDLSNGKPVVLSKGEIVTAVRSSMAIPSVFTAIDYNTTKLVDGGIIRNFPVTDVKDMGADIVIGVNLFTGLSDISKLNNAIDVLYRITQYRDAEDLEKEKKMCNLIIEPPVDKYSAGSFGSADDIMEIGKKEGKRYYPYFKHLADSLNAIYPTKFDPEGRLPARDSIFIDEINVEGIEKTSKSLLLDKLQISSGKSYTARQINAGFRKAYSSRYYDNVYYELKPTTSGHAILICKVKETNLTQVKLGLSYHSYTGTALFGNLTIRNLLLDKSRTMAKIALGDYFRALIEHKQAFGKKANNYINLSFITENLPLNFYTNDQKESLYKTNFSQFDLNFSKSYGTDWSTSVGICYQRTKFSPEVAGSEKVKGNMNVFNTYLRAEARTTDRRIFPTNGYELSAEAGIVFHRRASIQVYDSNGNTTDISYVVNNSPAFYKVMLNFSDYHSISKKLVFNYMLQSDICFKSQGFLFDDFYLGGVQQVFRQQKIFVGINEGQIISGSFCSALVGLQYNFMKDFFLLGKANTAIYDFSTATNNYDKNKVKYLNGFSLGLGYNLGILPMELTAMYSPEIGTLYKHIKIGFIF